MRRKILWSETRGETSYEGNLLPRTDLQFSDHNTKIFKPRMLHLTNEFLHLLYSGLENVCEKQEIALSSNFS